MLFAALSRRMPADGGPYAIGAVGGGMAVTLFSYLGVETASVAAAEVRDPSRNVPRATILGTLATAVEYVLALVAVLGILKDRRTAGAQVVDDHRQRSEQRRCDDPKRRHAAVVERLEAIGNNPSLAAASGISAVIRVQPFSAPKPETSTTAAITLPRACHRTSR